MAPTTRNSSKNEPSTPSKSVKASREKPSQGMFRVDPTTNLAVWQIISLGLLVSFLLVGLLTNLVLTNRLNLAGRLTPSDVNSFANRLEFLLRYQCLPATVLICLMYAVIRKRVRSHAINPLDGFEHIVAAQKNILQNSLEQYLLSLLAQLGLLCHLTSYQVLRYIPLMNVIFVLGRVLYALGYPKYRTAGFVMNFFTSIGANALNLFMLARFVGLLGH
jgi:hypothetical protein